MVSVPAPNKILDKVLSKADMIGSLAGFYTYMGSMDNMAYVVGRVMTAPRPPNTQNIITSVTTALTANLPLIIGGVIVDYLDIPSVQKYAKAATKFGIGQIIGFTLASALDNSHNPGAGSPVYPAEASSVVWRQNTATGGVSTNAQNAGVTASSAVMLPAR